MKKIIGITTSEFKDDERFLQTTNEDYIDAIIKAGGIPVLLPICDEEGIEIEQARCLDALLVTGGIDVNPLTYHENCRFEQGESSIRRDLYEIRLIKAFANSHKPILGICRGLQIINVAFGGTLYQDNCLASEYVQQHTQKEKRDYPIHSIRIKKETFLSSIFTDKAYVNSFHHQSIKKLADCFDIVARSEDSIIEAIQHHYLDIYAVQFHPESMRLRDDKMQQIFTNFINKCYK